jgi:hypothetical protein
VKVFFLYFSVGIAIIVGQTTVLSLPVFQGVFYDLLIPVVVFVRLNLPIRGGVLLVLSMGFVMGLFSGGAFGLYLTVYFWVFLGVQGISNFFEVKGGLFRSLLIGLCVLLQNLFFFAFAVFPDKLAPALVPQLGHVAWQVIFGAATGPTVIKCLERLQRKIATSRQEGGKAGKEWVSP